MKIVVVGGGLAGLMSAAWVQRYLPHAEVTLIEQQSWLGGKLRRLNISGQTVDIGPSIFTFPEIWSRYLATLGPGVSPLPMRQLDGLGDFIFADGSTCSLPDASSAWQAYLEKFRSDVPHVVELMINNPSSWRGLQTILSYCYRHGRSVRSALRWMQDAHLYPAIAIQSLNAGLSIDEAMSVFAAVPAAVHQQGVWIPEGGMVQLVSYLEHLCRSAGVRIMTHTQIEHIDRRSRRIRLQNADTHPYDLMISAIDAERWSRLTGAHSTPGRYSCSAFAVYGVTTRSYPLRHLHTVLMPKDFERFQQQISRSQPLDSTMCFLNYYPAGDIYPTNTKNVVGFLMTVPAGESSWTITDPLPQGELQRLKSLLGIDLLKDLESYQTIDPQYLAGFGAWGGSIYGRIEPWYRQGPRASVQHQRDRHHFQVGASVYPGGGIPGITAGVLQMIRQFSKMVS